MLIIRLLTFKKLHLVNSQKISIIIAKFEAIMFCEMINRLPYFLVLLTIVGCQNKNNKLEGPLEKIINPKEELIKKDNDAINDTSFSTLIEIYDDPERVDWQNPELVIERMGEYENKVIADIGAGTGYFTFRLINKAKKVIAIDIEERFLELIDERKTGLKNQIAEKLETRLVSFDDPSLKENEVDIVLLVNTYFNIQARINYLKKVKEGIVDGGRIIIVDYKKGNIPTGPPDELKISPSMADEELISAGFNNVLIDTLSLKYQYIITAHHN